MDNMEIYNKYRTPPKEALKSFDNGTFSGTDINTMWRIKCLTEQFGPVGKGWYIKPERVWREDINGETFAFVEISLVVKYDNEWSAPIFGTGGNKLSAYVKSKDYYKNSDEAYKMALTDAFGNACKYLGIGADVYWENDKTKYTPFENKKNDRVKLIETIKGDMPAETLREIATKHNCLNLAKAEDEDFAAFIKELKAWKS